MWIEYNPNPCQRKTGDCAIRAVTKALNMSWDDAYLEMCAEGFLLCDWGNQNRVWGSVLRNHGFKKKMIPCEDLDCYTAEDFAGEHFKGTYVLGFGDHVCTVVDGNIFDAFDSSREIPLYYFEKEA